jgi:hypothetical protein
MFYIKMSNIEYKKKYANFKKSFWHEVSIHLKNKKRYYWYHYYDDRKEDLRFYEEVGLYDEVERRKRMKYGPSLRSKKLESISRVKDVKELIPEYIMKFLYKSIINISELQIFLKFLLFNNLPLDLSRKLCLIFYSLSTGKINYHLFEKEVLFPVKNLILVCNEYEDITLMKSLPPFNSLKRVVINKLFRLFDKPAVVVVNNPYKSINYTRRKSRRDFINSFLKSNKNKYVKAVYNHTKDIDLTLRFSRSLARPGSWDNLFPKENKIKSFFKKHNIPWNFK